MSRQFIDTNILLYAYDPAAGTRHAVARQLVVELGRSRKGVLSVQVLQEFYVNVTRKIAQPLVPAEATQRLRTLSRWTVHAPTAEDVVAAAEVSATAQISFWDAMIVRSAAQSGCRTLWSEDLNAGQLIAGVRIVDPFA